MPFKKNVQIAFEVLVHVIFIFYVWLYDFQKMLSFFVDQKTFKVYVKRLKWDIIFYIYNTAHRIKH